MDIQKQLFDSFEIDEQFLPAKTNDEEKFRAIRQLLIHRIDELIRTDFDKLKWILYRIDISEKKLAETLKTSEQDASSIIADMIITRQLEKAESRKKFSEGETADWSFDL
ncbi:MAG TPA: hypothetical protein VK154_07130 [Chitinophagales bacterium]|nr:hypothetical protein [Chitinophagales bacterium]